MGKTTIHRFVLKSGDVYKGEELPWVEDIWDAMLFREKPLFPLTLVKDGKIVMVSVTFEELPYEVE